MTYTATIIHSDQISSHYKLVFEATKKGDDLFTAQNLRAICEFEDRYITPTTPPNSRHCRQVSLPSTVMYLTGKKCENLNDQDIDTIKHMLDRCAMYKYGTSE